MKKFQRFFTLALALCLSAMALIIPSAAADGDNTTQIIRLEDGSYVIITIECDQPQGEIAPFASRYPKEGSKNYSSYNSSDELVWTFHVHGTFTYDGTTATATAATYSYTIYDSSWSFVKGSSSYSGATATATGSFKKLLIPNSVTLTLTCSPTGVLS